MSKKLPSLNLTVCPFAPENAPKGKDHLPTTIIIFRGELLVSQSVSLPTSLPVQMAWLLVRNGLRLAELVSVSLA